MSKPKLQLDSLELEAFKTMLVDGKNHYSKMYNTAAYENLLYITQISEAYIKMAALESIILNVENKLKNEQYIYTLKLSAIDVFQLCSCILPTNNLTFYSKVKTIVLQYCISTLKFYQLIDGNICFTPSLPKLEIKDYFNASTTINNYFNE